MNVGSAPCSTAPAASPGGTIHEFKLRRPGSKERGGCVEGVSISCARTRSTGARRTEASAEAVVVARRESSGDGEERTSKPPGPRDEDGGEDGSGSPRTVQSRDRKKAVREEKRMDWMKVLFVPFHTPHAPSAAQSCESTEVSEDVDVRERACVLLRLWRGTVCALRGLGVLGSLREGERDSVKRRWARRDVRGGLGVEEVKYDAESSPESSDFVTISSILCFLLDHVHTS